MGARPGVDTAEVLALIDTALRAVGATGHTVLALATVTARAGEPGLRAAAARHGWPLLAHPPDLLATVDVPHFSAAARAALGTPSVAEAACLLPPRTRPHPNPGPNPAASRRPPPAVLLLPKRTSAHATIAIARHPPAAP
ncbi:Precorrin methylase (Partial) [Frankia sp. AiPs1]|uniref:cobalamin biosynthesis protein n=1 Tax=Frankia sp. AiPa1 TaxID=573492 RepID=UPI00202AFE70|nr:cobalamin biosynthesis protein [Frankia sp. AiPa1]MCL9759059.1 cobalamin biosynthesis protein [Frankia sp. AiPa1]